MDTNIVSSFFQNETIKFHNPDISERFLEIIDTLNSLLETFSLPKEVKFVYNSTIYARNTFEQYVRRYCNEKKDIMYFGMNPGPWGMSQTGVPFGEISSVRDWLKIEGPVLKPPRENKHRPVTGFSCQRTEISGKRFWGFFKELCGAPENFFKSSFVYNYLPQQWMKDNGCNLTPSDLKGADVMPLLKICDPIFVKVLQLYEVKKIVAIGKFCETRARKALKEYCSSNSIEVLYLPHPSPRTVNNNNWDQKAMDFLKNSDLLKYYQT